MTPLPNIVHSWLSLAGIRTSNAFIKEQILTHPDYPSLLSITDTLTELGLTNYAKRITKRELPEVPAPFLAHLGGAVGEFKIVDAGEANSLRPEFFKRWNGIVVYMDKNGKPDSRRNGQLLKSQQKSKMLSTIFLLFGALFIGLGIAVFPSIINIASLFLSIAGLYFSYLAATRAMGIDNKMADRVCGRNSTCEKVIKSNTSKLATNVDLSDLGIAWFGAILFELSIASYAGITQSILPHISLLTFAVIPFTVYAALFQLRMRKWCRICLIIATLFWLQFAILLPAFPKLTLQVIFGAHSLLTAGIVVITAIVWLSIKWRTLQNEDLKLRNYYLLRLKRHAEVFTTLLKKQRKVDITPFDHDLQLGNPGAQIQILAVCSPYCSPCAKVHHFLHELVAKHENDLGLTIRFAVNSHSKNDKRTKVVRHILQYAHRHQLAFMEKRKIARELVHAWFSKMEYDVFVLKFKVDNAMEVESWIREQDQWAYENRITVTPTLFINGYELPDLYIPEDLYLVFQALKVNLEEQLQDNEAIKASAL